MPFQKLEKDTIIPPYITKLAISKVEFDYRSFGIACIIHTSIEKDYNATLVQHINHFKVEGWVSHGNDFSILEYIKCKAYVIAYDKLVELLKDVSTLPKYEKQWKQLLLRAKSPTNHIELQEELDNIEDYFNQCYHLKNDNKDFAKFTQEMFNKHYEKD